MYGRVFEIREFTLHDGPGIRTTVFMKGCPLRCPWCHNPEGQSFEVETMVHKDGRRVPCGVDWDSSALADELAVNADVMKSSGGGVTFSGGEPLAQTDFLLEVIPLLKAKGISVALETSGCVSPAVYRRVVANVDFVYQDVKHWDATEYRRRTGGDFAVLKANVEWLRADGPRHVFRVPLIPGVNDADDNRARFAELIGSDEVEYLPYNPLAGAKYPMLGKEYPMKALIAENDVNVRKESLS